MTEFDTMPADPEQADLMHQMVDQDLMTAKTMAHDCETSPRTAYRIISGDTPLTVRVMRAMTRENDRAGRRAIGDRLFSFACRGTERLAVDLSYGQVGDVHADAISALRELADLLETRRAHEADGIITPQEALEEVEAYDKVLHVLHRGRKACAEQPTRERHKLKFSNDGGVS